MADIEAPPQPGTPEQAHHWLPLGALSATALAGALFSLLTTIGFAWLARGVFGNRFVAIDTGIITWLHGYWGPSSDQLMLFFTTLGDFWALAPLVVLAVYGLLRRGRWIDAAGLVLAGGGAWLLNLLLKSIFERPRPDLFDGPLHLATYSFPSGHAMGSIAGYGMLAFVAIRLTSSWLLRIAIALTAALLVFAIGLSRIYFGVHYPTDVIGGYLAGSLWLTISIGTVLVAENHARRRQNRRKLASDRP
jgi:undecaprenyl-diphosphatase